MTYFDTMIKALELIRELHEAVKKGELMSNFKDVQVKIEELKQALKVAKSESH